jgi:hypothetical protein
MGEFGRVEAATGGRLYSSAEEIEGPNASFATDAIGNPAPAASGAGTDDGGTVERVQTGSLTPRSGETYEQCVNRYKAESMKKYQIVGFLAGCTTGGAAGGLGGIEAGLPGVITGAALGCAGVGMTGAIAAAAPGASAGEVKGKVACDGLPGSPEAAKNAPPPPASPQGKPGRVP